MKSKNKDYNNKMMNLTEEFKEMLASSITSITDQINTLKSLPTQKKSPNSADPTTLILDEKRDSPLDGGQSTKTVACELSNMRSDEQNSMKSSSRHNSKETILRTSRNSTTTSRYVSMR